MSDTRDDKQPIEWVHVTPEHMEHTLSRASERVWNHINSNGGCMGNCYIEIAYQMNELYDAETDIAHVMNELHDGNVSIGKAVDAAKYFSDMRTMDPHRAIGGGA